ncbi:Flagellar protein FlaG protein, partial [Candidatus Magnetobacterium bavaricum]
GQGKEQNVATAAVARDNAKDTVSLSSVTANNKTKNVSAESKTQSTVANVKQKTKTTQVEEEIKAKEKEKQKEKEYEKNFSKAYFAIDDKDNVVIRIVDYEGKLIRQIPPEDYIKMLEAMDKNIESLFSTKA